MTRKRFDKAFLRRAKLGAVALSVVAFTGSLAGVAITNPAVKNSGVAVQTAAAANIPAIPTPPAQISQFSGGAGQSFSMPQAPVMPAIRPMVRTRGS